MDEIRPDIQRELTLFEAMCDKHLSFLIEDFGCRTESAEVWYKGWSTRSPHYLDGHAARLYRNEWAAISFQATDYGIFLGSTVYRLKDGKLPDRDATPPFLNALGLSFLAFYCNPKSRLHRSYLLKKWGDSRPLPPEQAEQKFELAFSASAKAVRECCADILRGDFTILDELGALSRDEFYAVIGYERSRNARRKASS